MKGHASTGDHQGALAWLDDSLEWTRLRGRPKLAELLNLVRVEVLLDVELSESPPSIQTPANRTLLGADRSA